MRQYLPFDYFRCIGQDLPECADCLRRTVEGDSIRQSWMLPDVSSGQCGEHIKPRVEA